MEKGNQSKQMLVDIFAAFVTSLAVSPTNAIIDRSVIQYANGKQTMKAGVVNGFTTLLKKPSSFFTSFEFKWMYIVYTLTYAANNLTDHSSIIPDIPIPIQNLLFTFCTNTSIGIAKDKAYIQHFGVIQPKMFPVASLLLLFTRDIITVASAFTLPKIIGKQMKAVLHTSERASQNIAQLLSPLLVQLVVTPIHLLGLDLYNRQGIKFPERFTNIRKLYTQTATLRMIRFLPAYGIGGILNRELRRALKH